jgi:hypothetical protein
MEKMEPFSKTSHYVKDLFSYKTVKDEYRHNLPADFCVTAVMSDVHLMAYELRVAHKYLNSVCNVL